MLFYVSSHVIEKENTGNELKRGIYECVVFRAFVSLNASRVTNQ